jgi:hypothetical protein
LANSVLDARIIRLTDKECRLSETRNPVVKSEWTIEAEKALEAAQKMRPGEKRLEALKQELSPIFGDDRAGQAAAVAG